MTSRLNQPFWEAETPCCGANPLCTKRGDPEISNRRILEIRRRIASGFYDRSDVILETAKRILSTGDIETDRPPTR